MDSLTSHQQLINEQGELRSWNLLASSYGNSTKGIYKRLAMVNDEPIVLMQTLTSTCAAMKPIRTTEVKQSTQSERGFVLIEISEGLTCEQ
jgi:hypothetical protein